MCPAFGLSPVHRTLFAVQITALVGKWPSSFGTKPAQPQHMNIRHLAKQLLHSVEQLITAVEDNEDLRAGLQKERDRLAHNLLLDCRLPHQNRGANGTNLRPSRRLEPPRLGLPAQNLYLACYHALDAGLLTSQRFDALMLLLNRTKRHARHRASSSPTPTSSSCLSPSSLGSLGDRGTLQGAGLASWIPARTCLSRTSTTCA